AARTSRSASAGEAAPGRAASGYASPTSQFHPTRRGVDRRCVRPAPNVSEPTIAATAIVSPAMLLTTGTTDGPRPRSSAKRAPETAVGDNPARAAAFASRAGL